MKCHPDCSCGRHNVRRCEDGCTCSRHPEGRPYNRADDYFGNHRAVRLLRGRAPEHACVTCCVSAEHWAQVHGTDGTDLHRHYMPMCISCHHAYDGTHERAGFHGRKHTDETKRKISERSRGHPVSAEQRSKISSALKGREVSPETRARMSAARKGTKLSAETKAKISASSSGRAQSEEERRKKSEALKRYWAEKRQSEEAA